MLIMDEANQCLDMALRLLGRDSGQWSSLSWLICACMSAQMLILDEADLCLDMGCG